MQFYYLVIALEILSIFIVIFQAYIVQKKNVSAGLFVEVFRNDTQAG